MLLADLVKMEGLVQQVHRAKLELLDLPVPKVTPVPLVSKEELVLLVPRVGLAQQVLKGTQEPLVLWEGLELVELLDLLVILVLLDVLVWMVEQDPLDLLETLEQLVRQDGMEIQELLA